MCVGQCCLLTRPLNLLGYLQHIEILTLLKLNNITELLLSSVLITVQRLMACSFTSVAKPQMLIRHCCKKSIHVPALRCWPSCAKDLLKIHRLLTKVPVSPVGWCFIPPSVGPHPLLHHGSCWTLPQRVQSWCCCWWTLGPQCCPFSIWSWLVML